MKSGDFTLPYAPVLIPMLLIPMLLIPTLLIPMLLIPMLPNDAIQIHHVARKVNNHFALTCYELPWTPLTIKPGNVNKPFSSTRKLKGATSTICNT